MSEKLRKMLGDKDAPCTKSLLQLIDSQSKGDLAVMSIETYEKLVDKFELHKLIDEGIDAMQKKKVRPFTEALADIEKDL